MLRIALTYLRYITALFVISIVIEIKCEKFILEEDAYGNSNACAWTKRENAPEVYWINMKKSVQRRERMTMHLNKLGVFDELSSIMSIP
jgi:hypothetical protein